GFDRVFLSGSERSVFEEADWISAQLDFVRRCADRNVALMGVCFGHQMVVRALYGKDALKRRESPEVGWRDIHFDDHWLFDGFSSPLPAFSFHFDEVIGGRIKGFDIIAESDDCPVQAVVHNDFPLVGVQFHPEIKTDDGAREIRERAAVLKLYGIDGERLVSKTPPERKTYLPRVLLNFVNKRF
ncbi:MAG: gamma-glutamyl-gamma-aminobutyrate hydrolase family protein, partial [Candidatus Coatesbacteria bacterium]